MKKIIVLLLTLIFLVSAFSIISTASTEPSVKASGVSVMIPKGIGSATLRFKMTVNMPRNAGIEVVEEGILFAYLQSVSESYSKYLNRYRYEEITLDTSDIVKEVRTGSRYTSGENYYEFVASFRKIPVHSFASPICARGYVTYRINGGGEITVYSDTAIYDVCTVAQKAIASSVESADKKSALQKYLVSAQDIYLKNVGGNGENLISITSPDEGETVYPYYKEAKEYVLSGTLSKQWSPYDSAEPIKVSWNNRYKDVESFTILYATKSDFSDAKYAFASANERKVQLYNLLRATDYYLKVIVNLSDGTTRSVVSTFKTSDEGPRVMHVDGVYNMRDLGGYMTDSGKRTLQGLIYRSGQLDSKYDSVSTEISDYGKYTAQNELKIKTVFDFRPGDFVSPIPKATRIYVGVGAYRLSNTGYQEKIKEAFSILADKNNYPLIFHCQGGADRTGTIAYLFNALLGVSEKDLTVDYEFTSYSIYGARKITSTDYIAKPEYAFFETLNAQKGDTLKERVENYLLSIGVTAEEIENIRSIMFDGIN